MPRFMLLTARPLDRYIPDVTVQSIPASEFFYFIVFETYSSYSCSIAVVYHRTSFVNFYAKYEL